MRSVIFYRNYLRYSGGHQKVLDYFDHLDARPEWTPSIYLEGGLDGVADNPWEQWREASVSSYLPANYDVAFLAGVDWKPYLAAGSREDQPVINLIQHVRHADPSSNVYSFLSERAVRICVSPEVEQAILGTGRVNGPTYCIPNGIDQSILRNYVTLPKTRDLYILGAKQPQLAAALAERIQAPGLDLLVHDRHVPRQEVLAAMAASKICILLPNTTEGFYLPALESMALEALTIVPDCVGNRSFCRDRDNCLMPALTVEALSAAFHEARRLRLEGGEKGLLESARSTVKMHSLQREREEFYKLLDDIERVR